MGEAEKLSGMKPIRIIEWDMLSKPRFVGAQVLSALGMRLAFHPFLVVQNRISMGAGSYSGMNDAFRKIVTREGLGALYINIGLGVVRTLPIAGEMFVYEGCRKLLHDAGVRHNAAKGMVAGAVAGGSAMVVGIPADIVMQHRLKKKPEIN